MPRFIFIHGNLDVPASFERLLRFLPAGERCCIDLEPTFRSWPSNQPVDVVEVARQLAKTYAIGSDDVVIGHSMGGWIAAHLKEATGATVIQLNSWTNPRKINAPTRNLRVFKAFVDSGLYQHKWVITIARTAARLWTSRDRMQASLNRLATIDPAYLYWQYALIFKPVPSPTRLPDLRIHSRRDPVIRPPDEPYVTVPGDHVAHWGFPAEVGHAITTFLTNSLYDTQPG
ncbi:hypothetical protein FAES_4640 [Fibrella aestuarina BUZ 2]|uniref:AB hydrolase-1 domain-containing protein n=1 Tax=Fibrella aestuarina BUZ 2 TaxID=1166018 RepID=I0KET6_9BACT|nr:alpha/beta hydrolase [Fibrella aestuarina]CCH02639.1 hypothetical protein FAES_4640 [Fibrella aestuarina BUZ 2]